MVGSTKKLRKAAILIRSLDGDTAASLLAQLSPDEATAVRAAMRELGAIESDEQADVLAEFRRVAPMAASSASPGVELELTAPALAAPANALGYARSSEKKFEFLEQAPIESLVPYLARERVQTIAVVLSNLPLARAAAVLTALPGALQSDVVERLTALGETDPDSLSVLEKELADWVSRRTSGRPRRSDVVATILTAAEGPVRNGILANLRTHKAGLADQIVHALPQLVRAKHQTTFAAEPLANATEIPRASISRFSGQPITARARAQRPSAPPIHFEFEDLLYLPLAELEDVLRQVDANVLVLALAGSSEDLVDRIAAQMPRSSAKAFRRQLRRVGPTRLSDVEAAQRAVANEAARQKSARRMRAMAAR